jgi:hypothetical protein
MFLTCMELTLQTLLLGFEAQSVISLRMRKLADGGPAAVTETTRMITEKAAAITEAAATFGAGGTLHSVVRRLRACSSQRGATARIRTGGMMAATVGCFFVETRLKRLSPIRAGVSWASSYSNV